MNAGPGAQHSLEIPVADVVVERAGLATGRGPRCVALEVSPSRTARPMSLGNGISRVPVLDAAPIFRACAGRANTGAAAHAAS